MRENIYLVMAPALIARLRLNHKYEIQDSVAKARNIVNLIMSAPRSSIFRFRKYSEHIIEHHGFHQKVVKTGIACALPVFSLSITR